MSLNNLRGSTLDIIPVGAFGVMIYMGVSGGIPSFGSEARSRGSQAMYKYEETVSAFCYPVEWEGFLYGAIYSQ